MGIKLLSIGFVLGVGLTLAAGAAFTQDHDGRGGAGAKGGGAGGGMPDEMKMMEDWIKSMKPGEHHKAMEHAIGSWETTTKIFMEGPNGPAVESKGTAERRWVLDGRFVQEDFKGEMMMPDPATGKMSPMPWKGLGLFGYDNFRNMHVGCWMDTAGTQMLTMKGAASPDGKAFTYYGEMDEPTLGVVGRTVKYETVIVDPDTEVFSITDLHAGPNYKVVEVTYKRVKK